MSGPIQEEGKFKYVESGGNGSVLLLLHGLFGALSNFEGIMNHFSSQYNVVIPILPIFELPLRKVSVSGLVDHVEEFVEFKKFDKVNVLGNSLGGHVSLLYTIRRPDRVHTLNLTGSSGLFESAMGSTFPKRGDYEFIKKKTESTFFDPSVATKELVDEVYSSVNDRNKAIRIIATAKSAVRHNIADKLDQIKCPTLLIWGKEDSITPPFVAEQFNELIVNSELHFLDKCGHAPMMELPDAFNDILDDFLSRHRI
ncbi:MAG: alpha/beta hydrolase [Saprospiraceae bacterium]|nr:alpha/beta hydrolase [Saprospiraceae bacterium]